MTGTVGRRLRAGFTLVELLVVMALIVLIAALAVAVANSGIIGSQKVVSAGDRASGWLLIAKMRAMRDRGPVGVRFFINPNPDPSRLPEYGGHVTDAQYIEAPEPWVPNPYGPGRQSDRPRPSAGGIGGGGNYSSSDLGRIVFVYEQQPTGSGGAADSGIVGNRRVFFVSDDVNDIMEFEQRIPRVSGSFTSGRELLLLSEFDYPFQITGWSTPTTAVEIQGKPYGPGTGFPNNIRELTLTSYPALGAAFSPIPPSGQPLRSAYVTYTFAFQETPRPLLGEPTLQLTAGTLIDFRPPTTATLLGASVDAQGYRTDTSPAPGPNPAPYHPPTTFGVTPTGSPALGGSFDILFSPSGHVMYNPNSLICLWVRDAEKLKDLGNHPRLLNPSARTGLDDLTLWDNAGEQVLVTVYPKTGMIATHPVPKPTGTVGYDPYSYAKDGVNSGL